jgi:hypothetical protein
MLHTLLQHSAGEEHAFPAERHELHVLVAGSQTPEQQSALVEHAIPSSMHFEHLPSTQSREEQQPSLEEQALPSIAQHARIGFTPLAHESPSQHGSDLEQRPPPLAHLQGSKISDEIVESKAGCLAI